MPPHLERAGHLSSHFGAGLWQLNNVVQQRRLRAPPRSDRSGVQHAINVFQFLSAIAGRQALALPYMLDCTGSETAFIFPDTDVAAMHAASLTAAPLVPVQSRVCG